MYGVLLMFSSSTPFFLSEGGMQAKLSAIFSLDLLFERTLVSTVSTEKNPPPYSPSHLPLHLQPAPYTAPNSNPISRSTLAFFIIIGTVAAAARHMPCNPALITFGPGYTYPRSPLPMHGGPVIKQSPAIKIIIDSTIVSFPTHFFAHLNNKLAEPPAKAHFASFKVDRRASKKSLTDE